MAHGPQATNRQDVPPHACKINANLTAAATVDWPSAHKPAVHLAPLARYH